jgi:hypothetical protein
VTTSTNQLQIAHQPHQRHLQDMTNLRKSLARNEAQARHQDWPRRIPTGCANSVEPETVCTSPPHSKQRSPDHRLLNASPSASQPKKSVQHSKECILANADAWVRARRLRRQAADTFRPIPCEMSLPLDPSRTGRC